MYILKNGKLAVNVIAGMEFLENVVRIKCDHLPILRCGGWGFWIKLSYSEAAFVDTSRD